MRKLTRSILATTAVVGLLALPVAGAGASDHSKTTTGTLELGAGGSLSVTAPTNDGTNPVALGTGTIAPGALVTTNGLGTVTASDTRTGLLRITTVNTASGLNTGVGFCQASNDPSNDGTVVCDTDPLMRIPLTSVIYKFGDITAISGTAPAVSADLTLGTASLAHASLTSGQQVWEWNPTLDVTLAGTEIEGTYYGVIVHSVS